MAGSTATTSPSRPTTTPTRRRRRSRNTSGWWRTSRSCAIAGWGTADTEALIEFIGKDQIPYYSGSYSGALTDPTGKAPKATKATPFNFFYGPSYSDACRALAQWAAEDWKKKGGQGKPKWVHMGDNHPYPNSPKAACNEYAQELGFEVLDPIQYTDGAGRLHAAMPDAEGEGRQLRLCRQHRRLDPVAAERLRHRRHQGAVRGQCLGL